MGSPRRQPQSTSSPQRRLHTSLLVPAQSDKKPHNNQLLCKSSQEQPPVGGIASAVRRKCCRIDSKATVPGLLQPVISGTQTQQPVATYLRPEHTEQLPENTIIQNGDPRDYMDLPPSRGVGDLHRFQRRILPYSYKQPVQEVHAVSYPRRDLPIQSTTLWSVRGPHGIYSGGQRGQISGNEKGYKNPPVPRQLVGQSQIPPNLSATHTNLGSCLSRIGLASERGLIRAGTQTGFQLCRLLVRPERGQGQTHPRTLADPTDIREIMSSPVCPVWNLMSLIGLLTATEKQVHLGRLHMRPIQWHLKNNWRVPETMEKIIPIPNSLHPHLRWWLKESNVLTGQPLHPLKHALQIFTDASKEGWGAQLNEHISRGNWSLPESKLHINHLELKAVLLALKEFQNLCVNNTVLIATDNTTVVVYINKEGGMKSGPLCALLSWRILTWCTRKQVTLKARHIPGMVPQRSSKQYATGGTDPKWTCLSPGSTTSSHNLSHRSQTPRHGQWMLSVYHGKDWTRTPFHHQPSWAKWWRSYRTIHATESF